VIIWYAIGQFQWSNSCKIKRFPLPKYYDSMHIGVNLLKYNYIYIYMYIIHGVS